MKIPGEEWQEEPEGSVVLGPDLARRYVEAGTMFLAQIEDSPIMQVRLNQLSPNGLFAKMQFGPTNESWIPLDKMRVLDVLMPMKPKDAAPTTPSKMPPGIAKMLLSMMADEVKAEEEEKPKTTKPRKKKE